MKTLFNHVPWLMLFSILLLSPQVNAKTTTLEFISAFSLDTTGDTDGDRLSDGIERTLLGTFPDLADSDGDGESDFNETLLAGNPLSVASPVSPNTKTLELVAALQLDTTGDTDQDLLSDGLESILLGTNPNLADTDGDLVSDFLETLRATNPFKEIIQELNIELELIAKVLLDTTGDSDQDRLSDGLERFLIGSDPLLADTDGDGDLDFDEILRGLNALSPKGSPPLSTTLELLAALRLDTTGDSDGDRLTDGMETNLTFTSVTLADTDLDGVSDFREILLQENPFFKASQLIARTIEILARLQLDTTVDRDQDGLSDGLEQHVTFTDFQLVDTDGDGSPDDIEILLGTNPFFDSRPPVNLRPVIQVDGVIDNTLVITIDTGGSKSIIVEATNNFLEWQPIATFTIDDNDPNPPSVAIPTDTDHAFFRIISRE